ncbi:TPA_inf: hypothetical protein gp_11 [Marinomonas phage YY]|nr:TPA_inf: hypothetical protein gp_11 [Marinomonas phage YY]
MSRIKTRQFSTAEIKQTRTGQLPHRFQQKAQFSAAFANGTVVAEYPVGEYTYRLSQLAIISDAEIVGKTIQLADGKHYVKTNAWADYVDEVELRLNGRIVRAYSIQHLVALQEYWNFHGTGMTTDGFVSLPFGGPGFLDDEGVEDMLMLGTANVRSVEVHMRLTGAFDGSTMRFKSCEEYAKVRRPASVIQGVKTMRAVASAAGQFSFNDIPIHDPITAIYFKGNYIKGLHFEVGTETLIDATASEIAAYNGKFRFNNTKMQYGIFVNFWRDGDPQKALAPLTSDQDRKENNKFSAHLDLSAATEVEVIIEYLHKFDAS